jgi:hypothetical protein
VTEPQPPTGGDRLATWLAQRERAFPRWLADYADLYNADRDASTRPFMAVRLTTDPDDLVPMRRMYDIFR